MADFRHPSEFIKFLLIGAQKAGTTWVDGALRQHPDVFLPDIKETHFFDFPENYTQGLEYYASLFSGMPEGAIAGECTPDYLWTTGTEYELNFPHDVFGTAERIHGVLPDASLIISLRNPVDRAISAFHHHRARGRIPLKKSLTDVWFELGIVSAGWYAVQLEEWYRFFDPSQFLVLIFEEDIVPNDAKAGTLNRICDHIGAPPPPEDIELDFRANDRLNPAMAYLNQVPFLRDRYRGQLLAQKIDAALPQAIQSRLQHDVAQADIDFLQNEFGPRNEALEKLLGRKLPW